VISIFDSVQNKDFILCLVFVILLVITFPSIVCSVSAESGELGGAVLSGGLPPPVAGQRSMAL
jgi:hypothetical protein